MELLTQLLPYFKILRIKNLIFIGLTIILVHTFLILPFSAAPILDHMLLYLCLVIYILTAGAGYVINDIMDQYADMLNKPDKTYIPQKISTHHAWIYYYCITAFAIILSISFDIIAGQFFMTAICATCTMILYLYSTRLKGTILWGNITISALIASVPGIILWIENPSVMNHASASLISNTFVGLILFSFLINLTREIIKDVEDMAGDKNSGILTLAGKYGKKIALKYSIVITLLLIMLIIMWMLFDSDIFTFRVTMYFLLFIVFPLLYNIQTLINAEKRADISRASTLLKWIMLAGVISIVLISNRIEAL